MRDDSGEAIDVDGPRRQAVSVALDLAIKNVPPPRATLDKRHRKAFIEAIAAGATITEACRALGVSTYAVHSLRRRDEDFADAVLMALEIGCDGVMGRLQAIAMHGPSDSMATVRAAEVYLRRVDGSFKGKGNAGVRLERTHPDGTVDRLTASANGIPD